MSGSLPAEADEIALDRMYAQNAGLEPGDTITLKGKSLKITGLIAVPDYSCLFESNTDMMFDSINFSVALMTEEGYETVESVHQFYNYAWVYDTAPSDDVQEKNASDDLLEALKETLISYNAKQLFRNGLKNASVVTVTDYLPRYENQAINFTGEDMGGDKAMFILFDYLVTVILAFVFAITISNTISRESCVIGTLRASGYSRGELIRHYMVLPVAVTFVAAAIGNLIGYTFLKSFMVSIYYNSYSLCTYETLWNAEAFLDTTVVPVMLMFVINLAVLTHKMKLSPLDFIRRNLSRRKKKRALHLDKRIPFMHRFRLRILMQNIPNYLTLFIGILLGAVIIVFGLMYGPLLEDYADLVTESMLAQYQYVMMDSQETENESAEKFCLTELQTMNKRYMTDEVSVYGIWENSAYITAEIPEGQVLVSNGMMDKYQLKPGDTLTLKEEFEDKTYDFVVAEDYRYDAGLAVFMNREDYLELFGKSDTYFTGYFSDVELTDLPEASIAAVITQEDLTKLSRQLLVSMGDFMILFRYFGVLMFILLMYLLSRQIIEKNAQSISMTKILGFTDGEIGGLYIAATSVVVIISLLLAVPITDTMLRWMFSSYLYTEITGYFPYMVSNQCFIIMVLLGIASYGFVALLQMRKISRIPKSDALKNVE
jgi:putative ABC transport system permease protein